ncbi:uncharacterized protein Syt12 [Eurosta solidaginis]|uniref:uncharacterized protein Syt12 n=1 Tax=Eurosta solidaginis TaxID=178769 RepID=UPI00353122E6
MDGESMSFSSLALIVLLAVAIIMLACHCLGPRANTWMRSNKEEKIGLSNNKLFHTNGYMMQSGSEFLLSNSGSFKRFDTIDKDDYRQSGQQATQHATTPLWNLAGEGEVDTNIPPQPLRPAPAPGTQSTPASACHIKTVTFSFEQLNETTDAHNQNGRAYALVSNMRSSLRGGNAVIPKPLDAPPPPRLSASSSALSASAIPRPVAKRQVSLQNGVQLVDNAVMAEETIITTTTTIQETEALSTTHTNSTTNGIHSNAAKTLQRHNSSTNPFLCESAGSLSESSTALNQQQQQQQKHQTLQQQYTTEYIQNSSTINGQLNKGITYAETSTTPSTIKNGTCNPFYSELAHTTDSNTNTTTTSMLSAKSLQQQFQVFRNRSFSTTEAAEDTDSTSLTGGLRRLAQNSTNPFNGLTQRVQKGPHMLQKTISEDFLFRKLGMQPGGGGSTGDTQSAQCSSGLNSSNNGTGNGAGCGGNTTWSFGRSLLRQDSLMSLGRRNSSQSSLDSTTTCGSMESINLERAISCDSVNSDTSSVFVGELDQPYTQITGYLCVGLQYDKNSITEEGMELSVMVLEAKGLICPFNVESLDTFVRIYLVPDEAAAMQTKVFKDSWTPCYNETFNYWLRKQHCRHSLWFHLYHNGDAHTLIGEAEMEISEMSRSVTTWIPLTDSRKQNAQWGELMFSLSYLPTAERLTIVVVKARNLKMELKGNSKSETVQQVQSVFVKVYLMNNEKKVLKKRTSLKRRDPSPIFNESVIFSVPPSSLTTVQLRFTVYGVMETEDGSGISGGNVTRIVPMGHVIAGACATGKGLRHWHQMISSLRKPVAMWHVLRRASYQPIFTGGAQAVVAAMQSTALRAKRNSII